MQHAAVFCVDEKSAIQALDRLDPVLPLSPGRPNFRNLFMGERTITENKSCLEGWNHSSVASARKSTGTATSGVHSGVSRPIVPRSSIGPGVGGAFGFSAARTGKARAIAHVKKQTAGSFPICIRLLEGGS
jgi:hypothetical protein